MQPPEQRSRLDGGVEVGALTSKLRALITDAAKPMSKPTLASSVPTGQLLASLSRDMLQEIFLLLPVHSLLSLMLTCKSFYCAVQQESFWKRRFLLDFALLSSPSSSSSPSPLSSPLSSPLLSSSSLLSLPVPVDEELDQLRIQYPQVPWGDITAVPQTNSCILPLSPTNSANIIFNTHIDNNTNPSGPHNNNDSSSTTSDTAQLYSTSSSSSNSDWQMLYKQESGMQWDVMHSSPAIKAYKRTAFKVGGVGWDNHHAQMRTKRGFRSSDVFIFKVMIHCEASQGGYGFGIADGSAPLVDNSAKSYLGSFPSSVNYGYYNNGFISSAGCENGAMYTKGDIVGFKLDRIRGTLQFFKNDEPQGGEIKDPKLCATIVTTTNKNSSSASSLLTPTNSNDSIMSSLPSIFNRNSNVTATANNDLNVGTSGPELFPVVNFAYEHYAMTVLEMKRLQPVA